MANDHICLALDGELAGVATDPADIRERLSDGSLDLRSVLDPSRGIIEPEFKWRDQTITVAFVDPSPNSHWVAKVQEIAPEWTRAGGANLNLEFVRGRQADITITFNQPRQFSSFIGTQCKSVSASGRPSMLLGFTGQPDETTFRSLILHEFGHALGMHHEHQNPEGNPINWDRRNVDTFFKSLQPPWSDAEIERNVLRRLARDSRRYLFTSFDPQSVMLYAFPPDLTVNRVGTERASTLSASDLELIAKVYPGRAGTGTGTGTGTDPRPRPTPTRRPIVVDGPVLEDSLTADGEIDTFIFDVEETGAYLLETTGGTDVVMLLCGPDDEDLLIRENDDTGEGTNARIHIRLRRGRYFAKVRVSTFLREPGGKYQISLKLTERG